MPKKKTPYQVAGQPVLPVTSHDDQPDINFEDELWEAAVQMRGAVAPADYKHYVLPLIFLRYLSLQYEKRYQDLERMFHDEKSEYFTVDPEIMADVLNDPDEYRKQNIFILPEECRWEYMVRHAQDDDIKLKLDLAMEKLEEAYPDLRGILPKIYGGSNLPTEAVTGLINLFSRELFSQQLTDNHSQNGKNADFLGRVYEYFITNFASTEGTRGGEFFTPRTIVRLLVEMMEPKDGKVFDPACGSGGMFVQSAAFTHNTGNLSFFGQESVDTTLRLCKMNLLLHGLNGNIKLGNSLLNDLHTDLQANFVIANPPFNLRDWGAEKISMNDKRLFIGKRQCMPTNSNANYFWMMHFLYHLEEGGTAGFVMANGSMTTSIKEERETRIALIEEGFVDCVVQLADRLFMGAGIPVCLWFFSKNREGINGYRKRSEEILFIDARKKGEMVNRRLRVLSAADIADISSMYHTFRNPDGQVMEVPGFCKVVTLEEIRSSDYKMTPGIYVGSEAAEIDETPFEEKMEAMKSELLQLFEISNGLQKKIIQNLDELS